MKSDDRLLFLGNPQQSVPKRLLLARNLSPRDKFTWQLLRLHARRRQRRLPVIQRTPGLALRPA